jgi:hypothetical protein
MASSQTLVSNVLLNHVVPASVRAAVPVCTVWNVAELAREIMLAMLRAPLFGQPIPTKVAQQWVVDMHLEDAGNAGNAISAQLMVSLIEHICDPPVQVNPRTTQVVAPTPVSLHPMQARHEAPIMRRFPHLGKFCAELEKVFGIRTHIHWFALFYYAHTSHVMNDAVAPSTLKMYLDQMGIGQRAGEMLAWMRSFRVDDISDPVKAIHNVLLEWQMLTPYFQVNLPYRFCPMPLGVVPQYAPALVHAPASGPPPPAPPPRQASAVAPKKGVKEEEEEGEEEEKGKGQAKGEESEEPPAQGTNPNVAIATASGGAKKVVDESELPAAATPPTDEQQEKPTSSVEQVDKRIGSVLPDVVAVRCKRATCPEHALKHKCLIDFQTRYGLDTSFKAETTYRLALMRLFLAHHDTARNELIQQYFEHPHDLQVRLSCPTKSWTLERAADVSAPTWHEFLSPFDNIESTLAARTRAIDLKDVDRFNMLVNAAAKAPGERATAKSVCIKRYLTAHYGGPDHWEHHWKHAWGEPSESVRRTVRAYLAESRHSDPETIQRIVYLVPRSAHE